MQLYKYRPVSDVFQSLSLETAIGALCRSLKPCAPTRKSQVKGILQ